MNKLEKGFSLIEVMLAALILSVSFLGLVQGQLVALRVSEYAYSISLADLKSNELAERLSSCSNKLTCIQEQLNAWDEGIKKLFPQAIAKASKKSANFQSQITWFSVVSQAKRLHFFYLRFRP